MKDELGAFDLDGLAVPYLSTASCPLGTMVFASQAGSGYVLISGLRKESWPSSCPDCGELIPIGGWPFCRSKQNPGGHVRGHYGWHFK